MVTVAPGALAMTGSGSGVDDAAGEQAGLLRELLDAGITVALGTGGVWPSMLWAMWGALRGWDGRARSRRGEAMIGREEALRMAVQSGHRLTWSEDRRGSLEIGKDADLVVLRGNPLTCPEDEIKDLPVDLTIVDGHVAHDRSSPLPDPASSAWGANSHADPRATASRRRWWMRWVATPHPGLGRPHQQCP